MVFLAKQNVTYPLRYVRIPYIEDQWIIGLRFLYGHDYNRTVWQKTLKNCIYNNNCMFQLINIYCGSDFTECLRQNLIAFFNKFRDP
jgi:hypothetical protein